MDLVHRSPFTSTPYSSSCDFFQVPWHLQHAAANLNPISTERKSRLRCVTSSPIRPLWGVSLDHSGCLIGVSFSTLCRRSITTRKLLLSIATRAVSDPELHAVLELASETELYELSNILYGPSLLSPLLKSVASGTIPDGHLNQKCKARDAFLHKLESRFFFLAADAKATLSGRRPMYRDVLLLVRKKLNVQCSQNLASEDMEAEIFLHLLQQSWMDSSGQASQNKLGAPHKNDIGIAKVGTWCGYSLTALRLSIDELCTVLLKGGGALTISTLQRLLSKELCGKMLVECARYRMSRETLIKGGQLVATTLESHVAMLSARQGFMGAASRYLVLRSAMTCVGPMLWGVFMADLVIRAVGTDHSRIIRAIFTFAQIRLTRTYGWTSSG